MILTNLIGLVRRNFRISNQNNLYNTELFQLDGFVTQCVYQLYDLCDHVLYVSYYEIMPVHKCDTMIRI